MRVSLNAPLSNDVFGSLLSRARSLYAFFGRICRRDGITEILDELPEGIVVLDAQRRYVAWNRQYSKMYAGTADLMQIGGKFEDAVRGGIRRGDYPDAIGREEAWLAERLLRLETPGSRYEHKLADGRFILIEDRRTANGGLVSLRVDITEMKQREASFRLLFEGNPLPMVVCRQNDWRIAAVNEAAVAHYGFDCDRFLQMHFSDIHFAVDPRAAHGDLNSQLIATRPGQTFKHVRRDGQIIEVELRSSSVVHNGQSCVMIAVIDVTEKRRTEKRVKHIASHDALTGLPNRTHLANCMQDAVEDCATGRTCALLFIDLDKFKIVNDTFGHPAGDALLKEVSRRLTACVRDNDTVARLGGDEYAVLLSDNCSREEAATIAQRILTDLRRPIMVCDRELHVGASIGIAMMADDAHTPEDLFRCSDVAMYAAKREGRGNFRFFDASLDEKLRARALLECRLQAAIRTGELEVHYQPLVSLTTGRVTCMEALVRWKHPERGFIPPGEFIPIAEDTGLILEIGAFVLKRACRDAAQWPDQIKVSVNMSAPELEQPEFLALLRSALLESGLPANLLQIEITESAVMNDTDRAMALLTQIRSLGVEIAMDDFGTGYSSLGTLRKLPFNKLKIDRAFIRDAHSANGHGVLSAIVSMAEALGMATTAEGVETQEQKAIVSALSCTEMQGYLYSEAKPLSQILALIQGRHAA